MSDVHGGLEVTMFQFATPAPSTERKPNELEPVDVEADQGNAAMLQDAGLDQGNGPPSAPTGGGGPTTYTVRRGDTLGAIAQRMIGDWARYSELWAENRATLPDPDRISIGQLLQIPASWQANKAPAPATSAAPQQGPKAGPIAGPQAGPKAGPKAGPQAVDDGPYSAAYGDQSQGNPLLEVERGQLTFDAEGQEGGQWDSRSAHWPGGRSGVTIGRGYDMGGRSYSQVFNDLVASGVPMTDATNLADGAGLRGQAAQRFVQNNTLPNISMDAQKALFNAIYDDYVGYVVAISNRPDVVGTYGQVNFDTLNPWILDAVTDLRYRGDYTAYTRQYVQPMMVANDVAGLADALSNPYVFRNVPEDRFERRKAWMEEAELAQKNNPDSGQDESPAPEPEPAKDVGNDGAVNIASADPKGILNQSRLNPQVKAMAAKTVSRLQGEGYSPYVFEGWRSYARQDDLFRQGGGVTGVTGGGSYHQYGLAVDIGAMTPSGTMTWAAPGAYWQRLGQIGLSEGFTTWGGDWGDMVHLQLDPEGSSARRLESEYEQGGGDRDSGVEPGVLAVWRSLGLATTDEEVGLIIERTSAWDAVLAGDQVLRDGSRGEAVSKVQQALNAAIDAGLDVDGQFGPKTKAAVKAFQSSQGQTADGAVGSETAARLAQFIG